MKPGQWAVVRGDKWFTAELLKITNVTPRYVIGDHRRQHLRTRVLAVFDTYPEAERLRSQVDYIRREFERRYIAAREWAENEMGKLLP